MTTVSAVHLPASLREYELSTTYIIGRVGNGDYGVALAYCTVLIVLMSLQSPLAGPEPWWAKRKLGRRSRCAPIETTTHDDCHEQHRHRISGPGHQALRRRAQRRWSSSGIDFHRAQGHADHHPRALGLRQDHHAAHDRRAGVADQRPHPHRRRATSPTSGRPSATSAWCSRAMRSSRT